MDTENQILETSVERTEDGHNGSSMVEQSHLDPTPERVASLNVTANTTQMNNKKFDSRLKGGKQSNMTNNSLSSPGQTSPVSPDRLIDDSRHHKIQSKFSLRSQAASLRNSAHDVRKSEYVMAGVRAIENQRHKYKNVAKLHQQHDALGHIENYDKQKVESYLSGKPTVIDVGGEEKLANLKVKLKDERPVALQQQKQDEEYIKSRLQMRARYDEMERNLNHGPWSQRGRGSVNTNKIDVDFSNYQGVYGHKAKVDARPDMTQYALDTFRDSKYKYVLDSSFQASFDPNVHSTTTESPRIGTVVKQLQMRKIFSMQGSQQTTTTGEGKILSQNTTTNNSTSGHGQSHIGKMKWVMKPSLQHQSSDQSLQRLGNFSTVTNMPKIRFGKQKIDQIHANIKAALNQELQTQQHPLPRTGYLPHRNHHQVLSGGIFDQQRYSISQQRDNPTSTDGAFDPLSNTSKMSHSQMMRSRYDQSRRQTRNASQWKSVTDKGELFSPRSPKEEAFFKARGKLNDAIQTLGVPEIKERVLMSQQSKLNNEGFNPFTQTRHVMSQETKIRLEKFKKPYQPPMSMKQMDDSIQSKARATATSIKHRKQKSNMPLHQQLLTLRKQPGKLADFYTKSNLQVVTEDEVKAGIGGFQVLIDPMKIKEISAEVDKQRKRRIQQTQKQAEDQANNLQPISGSHNFQALGQQLLNQEEIEAKRKRGEQVPSYVTAAMVEGLEDPDNIKAELEAFKFKQKLQHVEKQEMDIINKLYEVHFPQNFPEKQESQIESQVEGQSKLTNNNQVTLVSKHEDASENDPFNNLSTESKQILQEHLEPSNGIQVTVSRQGRKNSNLDGDKTEDVTTNADNITIEESNTVDPMKERQEVRYVQYVPKRLGQDHVDLDAAIKSLYSMNVNNISPHAPRPKFGSQDSQKTGNDIKLNAKYKNLKGFMYGQQGRVCKLNHAHSRECSKIKDLDISNLQTLAFQFMLLQKPEFYRGVASNKAEASFFPSQSKLSQELQNSYKEIEMMRKMSMMSQQKIDTIFSKFKRDQRLSTSPKTELLPGQEINPNEIPSSQRLQMYVQQLIESQEGTSALEEKLRQIVNTINLRENAILKNKTKQQEKNLRMETARQQTTRGSLKTGSGGTVDGQKSRLGSPIMLETFHSDAIQNNGRVPSLPATSNQPTSPMSQTSPVKVISPMSTDTRIMRGTDGLSPMRQEDAEIENLRMEQSGIDEIWKQYESERNNAKIEQQTRSFSGERNNPVIVQETVSPSKRKSVQVKYSKNSSSVPGTVSGSKKLIDQQQANDQAKIFEEKEEQRPPTSQVAVDRPRMENRGEKASDCTLPTYQSQKIDSDPNMSMADQTVVQHSKDQSMLSNIQNSRGQHQQTFSSSYQVDQMLSDPKFTNNSLQVDSNQIPNASPPPQSQEESSVQPELQTIYIRPPNIKTQKSPQSPVESQKNSIDDINNASDSPLSNENIRILTHKEQSLNKKYIARIIQEQRQAHHQYNLQMRELSQIQREISFRKQVGTQNKMVWKSPFAHRQNKKEEKKYLIETKRVENLERFPHHPQTRTLSKSYNQWSLTDLNKRDMQLKQMALEQQLKINNVIQVMNLLKQKEMDLMLPLSQQPHQKLQIKTQESSASPQRIKYYDNKYPAEESIAEMVESEQNTTLDPQKMKNVQLHFPDSSRSQNQRIKIPIASSDKDTYKYEQLGHPQVSPSFEMQNVADVLQGSSHHSTIRKNVNYPHMTSDKKLSEMTSSMNANNSLGRPIDGMDQIDKSKSPSGSFKTLYEVRMKMNTSPVVRYNRQGNLSPNSRTYVYKNTLLNPNSADYEHQQMMQNQPESFGQMPHPAHFGLNLRKTVEFQKQHQPQITNRDTSKGSKEQTGTFTQDEPRISKVKLGPSLNQKKKKSKESETQSGMDKTHRLIHDLSSPKNKPPKIIRKSPINNLDLPQKIFDEERDLLSSQRQKRKPSYMIGSNRHSYLPKKKIKLAGSPQHNAVGFKTITPQNPMIEAQEYIEGHKPVFSQRPSPKHSSPRSNRNQQINVVMQALRVDDQKENFGEVTDQQIHTQFKPRLGSRGSNVGYRKKLPNLQNQSLSPQQAKIHNRGTLKLEYQGTIMLNPGLEMQPTNTDNTQTRELSRDVVSSDDLDSPQKNQ